MKSKLAPIAALLVATLLPLAFLAGTAIGTLMKVNNPDNIDITQGLAYLGYYLIPGVVVLAAGVVVIACLGAYLYKHPVRISALKFIVWAVCINIVLIVGILGFRVLDGVVQDNWSREHGQPTREERDKQLDEFFKNLEKPQQ